MADSGPVRPDLGISTLVARMEALAVGAAEPGARDLAAELAGLRTDLAVVRDQLGRQEQAQQAALAAVVARELAPVRTALAGLTRAPGSDLARVRLDLEERLAVLEDALAGLAERVEGALRGAAAGQQQAGDRMESALAGLGGAVAAAVDDLAGAVEGGLSALAATVDAALAEMTGAVQESTAGLVTAAGFDAQMQALRADLADAVEEVRDSVGAQLDTGLREMRLELSSQLAEATEELRRAAELSRTELAGALARGLAEAADALRAGQRGVEGATGALERLQDRLAGTGRALLDYLVERDLALEAERDRVLHQLLDDVAAGLAPAQRSQLARRASGLLERRRAERDAARWRSSRGSSAPPPALVDEAELLDRLGLSGSAGAGEPPAARPGTTGPGPTDPGPAGPGPTGPAQAAVVPVVARGSARARSRVAKMPVVPDSGSAIEAAVGGGGHGLSGGGPAGGVGAGGTP